MRDSLLGRPVADRDWVVVGGSAREMLALGYRQVGRDFPVFLHPQTHEEYALARTERKQGRGHRGFTFETTREVTLEQDLARRDVTINAMARDPAGRLIDPHGGQRDLAAGVLRHITPAFAEDPLRVLRVARFAARFEFAVAPETLALMREIADGGELATLSPERVWRELERALMEPHPARFISVLQDCDALVRILPEISVWFARPSSPVSDRQAAADQERAPAGTCGAAASRDRQLATGRELLRSLTRAAAQAAPLPARFALLVRARDQHTDQERVAAVMAACTRLRVPVTLREAAVGLTREYHVLASASPPAAEARVDLLERLDAFRRPERLEPLLIACLCDAAPGPEEQRRRETAAQIRAAHAACRNARPDPAALASGDSARIRSNLRQQRVAAVQAAGFTPAVDPP